MTEERTLIRETCVIDYSGKNSVIKTEVAIVHISWPIGQEPQSSGTWNGDWKLLPQTAYGKSKS